MPCWTVQTVKVQLQAGNFDLLQQALKDMQLDVRASKNVLAFSGQIGDEWVSGTITKGRNEIEYTSGVGNTTAVTNAIKRAYSTEIVKQASSRFRWNVKQAGAGKMKVSRRF